MIVYDSRWIGRGGIGRFADELRQGLVRHVADLVDVPTGGAPCDMLDPLRLGVVLRRQRPDVFLSPGFNVPIHAKCPVIATVHDLIHLSRWSPPSRSRELYYRRLVRPAIQRAPVTFTVSEYSKRCIVEFADVPPERVVVVGNGVRDGVFRCEAPAEMRVRDTRPRFLYVGVDKPHKNIPRLLEAFKRVRREIDATLTIVGQLGERTRRLIRDLEIEAVVDLRSKVADAELAHLYATSNALVQPSLAEGFGLPIIEAMAAGCAVVGSRTTAVGEVIGDAGWKFDPEQIEDIAHQMLASIAVGTDRERMLKRGRIRARGYRWDSVAKRAALALQQHCGIDCNIVDSEDRTVPAAA